MNFLIILLISFIFINPSINAQQPTPTIASDKIEDVKDIVKQIVKNTSGEDEIETVSNKPKSYFGNITKIDENTITISYKNEVQLVQISDDTVYVDLKRNKSKLTNFKVGQEILAMGYLKEDKSLDGKRIVATQLKSVVNNYQTITGQIVDISKETSIFTLTPNFNKNSPFQLKTDSKTQIINLENKTVSSSQAIVNGKKIIAIIKPDLQLQNTFYTQKIIVLNPPDTISPTPTIKP